MPHPISALGAGHTIISLIPLIAGVYSFARYRKIDNTVPAGKIYLIGLVLAVLTSFGLSSSGGDISIAKEIYHVCFTTSPFFRNRPDNGSACDRRFDRRLCRQCG